MTRLTYHLQAFDEASSTTGKPTAILAKTFKGYKFPAISDMLDWHGKPLGDKADEVIRAIQDQMEVETSGFTPKIQEPTEDAPDVDIEDVRLSNPPAYKLGEMVATRLAYGTALAKLAEHNPRVIALDGDTKNSTYSEKIKKVICYTLAFAFNSCNLFFHHRFQWIVILSASLPSKILLVWPLVLAAATEPFRSFPRLPLSSLELLINSVWEPFLRRTSLALDLMLVSRSVKMARPRWLWKTWPCSVLFQVKQPSVH